ncbi:MAG: PorV/PorQ family protein [Saprospiraceae bacterium]|nr:PorV/PorQ family protein [Saprospiraceae bacterium]
MKNFFYNILAVCLLLAFSTALEAGNPDRQGEAGAYELLLNPWAKSAGLHTMSTSMVTGVEAMRLNVAGISRINQTEVLLSNANYLQGTGIRMNAAGVVQRVGQGAFGISLMALDFGDIPVTTEDQPEGTGSTFSPTFFHIGLSYAHTFENKVSVGILFRGISETISNLSAFGFAVDAGVQYVTGPQDNFKFGISLRNVGSRMEFGGEGLNVQRPSPSTLTSEELTFSQRAEDFELPSMLNLGMSYDFLIGTAHRVTVLGNFTSNSFSQDQIGAGLEYSLNEYFMLRGAYKYEVGSEDEIMGPIYTGLSAGATIDVPLRKKKDVDEVVPRLGIDYAYRATKVWDGTHNISVRISL